MNPSVQQIENDQILLQQIQNAKIKNLLRGLQDKRSSSGSIKTLEHLRVAATATEIQKVTNILIDSPLYEHLELPPEFPTIPPNLDKYQRLAEVTLEKQLAVVLARYEANNCKLESLISEIRKLNDDIVRCQFQSATSRLQKMIENYGYSIFLLKKAIFIYSNLPEKADEKSLLLETLNDAGLKDKNLFCLGCTDIMGETYIFTSVRRNLREARGPDQPANRFINDLIDSIFSPTPVNDKQAISRLQTFAQASLFDALLFVSIYTQNVPVLPTLLNRSGNKMLDKFVSSSVGKALKALSHQPIPMENLFAPDDLHSDFKFYRHSIAWMEISNVSKYRAISDPLYWKQSESTDLRSEITDALSDEFFADLNCMSQLACVPKNFETQLTSFDTKKAGVFSRSIAFIYALGSSQIDQEIDGDPFLKIMDGTRDIALHANPNLLRSLQNNSPILSFVISLLVMEHTNLNADNHKARRLLQDIVRDRFGSNIIDFLNYLDDRAEAVATKLFETCDETFLGKLFFLIDETEPEKVFETRAMLLDWQAKRSGEPLFADRAKTLRLDQKIQRARGELDDTRIFVDSFRFKQWIEDNELDELSSIFSGEPISLDQIKNIKKPVNFIHTRQPEMRLAVVLSNSFTEFCSNRKFGIASFLGRRIRHGTLKGVLFSQLNLIPEQPIFQEVMYNTKVADFVNSWMQNFEVQIEKFGKLFLQIRDENKSLGAIDPDIFQKDKIATARVALREIIKNFEQHKNLHVLETLIQSYCWRLVDVDLKAIRDKAARERISWGMINASKLAQLAPDELRESARALAREINNHTDMKFKTLCSWFNEPANLSPTAPVTLLFDVVMGEVKEQFPNYDPKLKHEGMSEIILKGGAYHLVYDGLKIAIENAAKHGASSGLLVRKFETQMAENDTTNLTIEIRSQLKKNEQPSKVQAHIDEVMNGDVATAMDEEGKSGFRKLLNLKEDTRELRDVTVKVIDDMVHFACHYVVTA